MQGPATLHTFAAIVRLSGFNEDLASMLGAKLTTRLQSMTPPQLLRDTDQTTIARLVNEIIAADDYLQLQVAAMHNRSQRLQAMSLESRMTALTLLAPDWLHKMPQDHFEPAKPITILFGSCRDGVDSDITPIAADDDLYYGKVDVAVPPRPVPCEADETASRCFRLGWHALKADIQSTVNSGTTHGFIFVHGFHNSFVNAAKTTAQLCADLADGGKDQARVVTFMFAWPSTTSMLGYGLAQTNKDASMLHFERFVAKVADEMAQYQDFKIHVIAHDMGCHFALHLMDKKQPFDCQPIFGRIIMIAPDVPSSDLHSLVRDNRISDRVQGSHVFMLFNARDRALLQSEGYHNAPRAGQGAIDAHQPWFHVIDTTNTVPLLLRDPSINHTLHQQSLETASLLRDLARGRCEGGSLRWDAEAKCYRLGEASTRSMHSV